MQTFLPYEDFEASARVLDYRRLGKQRSEAKQILYILLDIPLNNKKPRKGWVNHTATRMWRGYDYYLCLYGISICKEWINRGYRDQQLPLFEDCLRKCKFKDKPYWLGDPEFHLSHQSNLVRKKPEHYRQYFPNVPDNLEYIWPISK